MSLKELSAPELLQKGQIWNKPKTELMLQFEEETGYLAVYGGRITGQFEFWLFRKGLKKSNFSKRYLSKEPKKKIANGNRGKHLSEEHKQKISDTMKGKYIGKNNPNYGKFGKESSNYKENATKEAKHKWIRIHYPPEKICQNKCEICDEFRLDLELARFLHINVRNIDDPMMDYLYMCPEKGKNCKNNCHTIYGRLSHEQQKKLLSGAITREEKLKRVKKFILEIKK